MIFKYLPKTSLEETVLSDKHNGDCFYITSISDMIQVVDEYSKENQSTGKVICSKFKEKSDLGIVYLAEFDQSSLSNSLHDESLWEVVKTVSNDPIHIIRHLSLKKYDESIWWSEEIYSEMKDHYE